MQLCVNSMPLDQKTLINLFEFLVIKDANTASVRICENGTTLMTCRAYCLSVKWCCVHFAKYAILSIRVLRNKKNNKTLT
jgi:hypothetical protein